MICNKDTKTPGFKKVLVNLSGLVPLWRIPMEEKQSRGRLINGIMDGFSYGAACDNERSPNRG